MNKSYTDGQIRAILAHVDHTLLRPDAPWEEVRALCDDAVIYHTASVCIAPSYVAQASTYLNGAVPICTVIGFPNGYNTTAVKCAEAADAVDGTTCMPRSTRSRRPATGACSKSS